MSNTIPSSPSRIDFNALLVELDSGGQSAAAFARSNGLAPWKIYNALKRRSGKTHSRRGAALAAKVALLPVHVVDAKPAARSVGLVLLLAGGHRLLIGPEFDAHALRRLVEVLSPC